MTDTAKLLAEWAEVQKIGPAAALGNKSRMLATLGPDVVRAWSAATGDVPSYAAARRGLEAGGGPLVARWDGTVDAFLSRIRPTMRQALFGAAAAEARRIKRETGCDGGFDVLADGVRYAAAQAEDALREILRASGRAQAATLAQAVASGELSPADGARLVVDGRALALADNAMGATAVLRYRQTQLARGRKADRTRALTAAYGRSLARQRGATIATTELGGIYEEGMLQAALQATQAGCLGRGWAYQWVARIGATPPPCKICVALHGKTAFPPSLFEGAHGSRPRPPAHPRCRCTLRLVRVRATRG